MGSGRPVDTAQCGMLARPAPGTNGDDHITELRRLRHGDNHLMCVLFGTFSEALKLIEGASGKTTWSGIIQDGLHGRF